MKYGLQMYSVRDVTPNDMDKALREVAAMGYSFVEFAGFFGHDAEEIKEMLDKYGLTCSGTHSGWEGLLPEKIGRSIQYHKTIGCENYIIPGADLSTREKLDEFIRVVNAMQPVLEGAGIRLHYHNHSHEFLPTSYGAIIHEELQQKTALRFEIDTYWAFHAGKDPLAMLDALRDRVSVIHLKDGVGADGRSLGEGNAPVAAVRKKAIDYGMTMVVESESLQPDGLSEVKRCIDFLKACDAQDGN